MALTGGPYPQSNTSNSLQSPSSEAVTPPLPSPTLNSSRGLLVVSGEHGRSGGQGSRARGSPEGYFEQRLASLSHVELLRHLASRDGVVMDVVVLSYTTPYQKDLCEWYSRGPGTLLSCDFLPETLGIEGIVRAVGERTVLNGTLASTTFAPHSFVLLLRPDIILKGLFLRAINPRTDRITWSHNAQFDPVSQGGGRFFRD